jgi:hypothetical protein
MARRTRRSLRVSGAYLVGNSLRAQDSVHGTFVALAVVMPPSSAVVAGYHTGLQTICINDGKSGPRPNRGHVRMVEHRGGAEHLKQRAVYVAGREVAVATRSHKSMRRGYVPNAEAGTTSKYACRQLLEQVVRLRHSYPQSVDCQVHHRA